MLVLATGNPCHPAAACFVSGGVLGHLCLYLEREMSVERCPFELPAKTAAFLRVIKKTARNVLVYI